MIHTPNTSEMRQTWLDYHKEAKRPWNYVSFVLVLIGLLGLIEAYFGFTDVLTVIVLTNGIILTLVGVIAFLVNQYYVREKVSVQELFPEIVKSINLSDERNIEYQAYPKEDRKFFQEGGLFTRNAFAKVRYRMDGKTEEGIPFTLMNLSLIVSTGSASHEVFRGIYIYIPKDAGGYYQIKTRYRPSIKGAKFEKIGEEGPFTIYREEETVLDDTLLKARLQNITSLHQQLEAKHSYFGSTNDALHFAFTEKAIPYKLQTAEEDEINAVRARFKLYLSVIEKLNISM